MLTRLRVRCATAGNPDEEEDAGTAAPGFWSRLSRRRLAAALVPFMAVERRFPAPPMEKGASCSVAAAEAAARPPNPFSFSSIPSSVACQGRFLLLLFPLLPVPAPPPPLAGAALRVLLLPLAPSSSAANSDFPPAAPALLPCAARSVARRVE